MSSSRSSPSTWCVVEDCLSALPACLIACFGAGAFRVAADRWAARGSSRPARHDHRRDDRLGGRVHRSRACADARRDRDRRCRLRAGHRSVPPSRRGDRGRHRALAAPGSRVRPAVLGTQHRCRRGRGRRRISCPALVLVSVLARRGHMSRIRRVVAPSGCRRRGRRDTTRSAADIGPHFPTRCWSRCRRRHSSADVVYLQSFVTLPLVMSIHGLGPSAYGLAYVVNPVAVIVLQPITIRWLARQRLVLVFAAAQCCSASASS